MRFNALRLATLLLPLMLLFALAASRPSASSAQSNSKNLLANNSETGTLTVDVGSNFVPPQSNSLQMGANYTDEVEQNGSIANANVVLGRSAAIRGNIYPVADEDFFAFTAEAGDRVYIANMTLASPAGSTNSIIEIQDSLGVVLELDDDDGQYATNASSIAGTTIPTAGTYYIRIKGNTATVTIRPYNLYLQLQNGSPTAEAEPNDTLPTANALPVNGWVSGSQNPANDDDYFMLHLLAGDTVYLSLDLDPERDNVTWNGRLGFGLFGNAPANQLLFTNDGNTTSPNSEAFFLTIKDAGTYFVFVDDATPGAGSPTSTYHLSVTVFPAAPQVGVCNTYTSTDTPIAIPTGPGVITSNIVVPGNPIIADLDLHFDITHNFMADLDAVLTSPANNVNSVFTDIGSVAQGVQTSMNLILDDEAALPPSFVLSAPMNNKPESNYRLSWFDGSNGGGNWTLTLYDDAINDGGTLNSWSITICEPEPPPSCPIGTAPTVVYSSNFEAGADGFTHSGTVDEWELGLPTTLATTSPPIAAFTSCNSGTSCWKTDLDNTYDASSSQNLLSPNVDLAGLVAPVVVSWAQRYQIESASFDHAFVDAQQVGGATPVRLWEWLDGTMDSTSGSPSVNIGASSGWSIYSARADSLAGLNTELLFHLDSDNSVQLGGWAVDDVSITACAPTLTIELTKTVGTDSSSCATTSDISLPYPGGNVTYCYTVENTGSVTATNHTLIDDQLGTIFSNMPYTLTPGATTFVTQTVMITESVTNVAEWMASYGVVTAIATATATVTVDAPVYGVELSADLSASGEPGEVVTYTVSITNVGNISSGFMLTVEDSSWTTTLSDSTVVLDVGEVDSFEAYVTIPLTATDGMMDTALVMATSAAGLAGGGVATDTVELTTTAVVNAVYGVELSADLSASSLPGEVVTYTVSITNVGNISSGFMLTVEDSSWTTTLSDSTVVLDVGEVDSFEAYVTIPLTATDGMMDTALVMATSAAGLAGGGVATDTVELTTTAFVAPVYGVDLSADMALTGTVGSMVTYTMWITNNGTVQDTFEIEATAVWTTTLSTSSVVINAGEASEITVVVYIPATATDLETDEATITATSQGDSNTNDVTHLTTTALEEPPAGYHLYLPVINRN